MVLENGKHPQEVMLHKYNHKTVVRNSYGKLV